MNQGRHEMEMTFIEGEIGTRGIYSLPVGNVSGGTTLVTVVLDELLWRHQLVVIGETVYPVECYKAIIRDRHAQRLVGSKVINVHARESTAKTPGGEEVRGWVLTTQ
jgi:hypothetical protein